MERDFSPSHPELMDRDDTPLEALREQLRRLEQINRWFGGHAAVRAVTRRLFRGRRKLRVADLATGFGDHPRRLAASVGKRTDLKIFAVDRHAATLRMAREATPRGQPIHFVQADVTLLPFKDRSVDIAICSLALHHFSEEDAMTVLEEEHRIARDAAVVIDLVRGRLAYAATWLLTQIWMRDEQTRHDGRLSVRRAFRPGELKGIAALAGWRRAEWLRLPWFRQALVVRNMRKADE